MNILIVGYGNIGKHIYAELAPLKPDIYDPYQNEYKTKKQIKYDMAFICVPTDKLPDGSCDTSVVELAVSRTDADIIVIKSTVPPETTKRLIAESGKKIIFSPEHYGVTQHCRKDPGFIILGGEKGLCEKVAQAYARIKNGYYKFYFTDSTTAELTKYMLNTFLALKVTFCNEFADIAAKYGVSYPELRELFVADDRVGNSHTFVYPEKPYYDSHCFNKDVPALLHFAGDIAPLTDCMDRINSERKAVTAVQNNSAEIAGQPAFVDGAVVGNAPSDMRDKIFKEQREKASAARNALLEKSRKTDYKYEVALCLIIRDENEYLKEWLDWHIKAGVQHFYIYDHGSKTPVAQFIKTLGKRRSAKITVVDWSGSHKDAQPEAYNHCLNAAKGVCRWLGFIDTDEQVSVKTGEKLTEFLKGYEDYAGLFVNWVTFNAGGRVKKTDEPLRERFRQITHGDSWADTVGKVFVQPDFMKEMYIHNGEPQTGFDIVDENKTVVPKYSLTLCNPSHELISVDHFYTKSYEEWVEKMNRGSAHSNFSRSYDEFFALNPDMRDCREEIALSQKYEDFG